MVLMEHQDRMEPPDNKELVEALDQLVKQVPLVLRDLKDQEVLMETLDLQVHKAP